MGVRFDWFGRKDRGTGGVTPLGAPKYWAAPGTDRRKIERQLRKIDSAASILNGNSLPHRVDARVRGAVRSSHILNAHRDQTTFGSALDGCRSATGARPMSNGIQIVA